jgi:uroporphyrinogen III methyltransferase/synthase
MKTTDMTSPPPSTGTGPLEGISILITRASHQSAEFVAGIERLGGTAYAIPTIEIRPPASWEACDRALDGIHMYDGLIFTSANGVEFFFRHLIDLGTAPSELSSKKIFVVGEKTRDALSTQGLSITLMPAKFTADELARAIGHEDLHGRTFLFPRGNLGKDTMQDTLRLLGATVDAVTVYTTVHPADEHVHRIRALVLEGSVHIVTFTSPSTFSNFVNVFTPAEIESIRSRILFAAIGPVTTTFIRSAGFPVPIQASESTTASLTEAIERHIRQNPNMRRVPTRV